VDLDDHALLARAEIGIAVLTEILFRQLVDVLAGALVDEFRRSADHDVAILLILRRQDGNRRTRVTLDVLHLGPAICAVDEDCLPVVVDPHRGHMG
jgi:hypothetical protein